MTYNLIAINRTTKTTGELNALRSERKIPAVVYGHASENRNITLDYHDFVKLLDEAGTSSIIELTLDGESQAVPVLISEVQRNPVDDRVIHVDLHQIRMDEKIRTELELNFVGESPAVKELGGNMITNMSVLNIECLPKDLISSLDVDISVLKNLDDSLHVKDIAVPESISVLEDPNGSVVSVLAPRVESETVETPVDQIPVEGEDATTGGDTAAEGEEGKKQEPEGAKKQGEAKESK